MDLEHQLKEYVGQLDNDGLLRERLLSKVQSKPCIAFDSNDFLSLTQDERIAAAYQEGYSRYPSGSGGSMLLCGYQESHQILEQAFADFLSVDECIIFSSGYAANLAVTALLGQLQTHCFIDKSAHASIYDGLRLSNITYSRYLHNDLNDLQSKMSSVETNSALITEGLFSMSGQLAPLSDISSLCKARWTALIVDEAHSIGVVGTQGRGAVDQQGLTQEDVPLRILPMGKAFAGQGALIAGKKEWIRALLQAGRSLIYSTAISPALCYGLLRTLDVVAHADEKRNQLQQLIAYFRQHIKMSPLNWTESSTAIQQLVLGCPNRALEFARVLREKGFACSAIRSPTVTNKNTGLRIILNAHHQPEHIDQLFYHLNAFYEAKHL